VISRRSSARGRGPDEEDVLWVNVVLAARLGERDMNRASPAPEDDTCRILVKGREVTPDEVARRIRAERPARVHLHADAHVRWVDCRPIVLAAQERSHLRATFAGKHGLPGTVLRLLDLPVAPGLRVPAVAVRIAEPGSVTLTLDTNDFAIEGKTVSLTVPDDARAGEVLQLALGLRAGGARVAFE
jgi:hypothetical protein